MPFPRGFFCACFPGLMTSARPIPYALIATAFAVGGIANAADPQDKDRVGGYEAAFSERSPHSTGKMLSRKLKNTMPHTKQYKDEYWNYTKEYTVGDDKYDVYASKNYTREKPAGIFVWCSPGTGGLPGGWKAVADKYNLILITAKKAGNDRKPAWHRIGLALDALHNLPKAYATNPKRHYIGGLSGGGGIATGTAFFHPELVTGVMICGAPIPLRDVKKKIGASWDVPSGLFSKIKANHRHVMITGEKDTLVPPELIIGIVNEGYAKWGFKNKPYYAIMKGLGHVPPDAATFERAIRAFDGEFDADKTKGYELPGGA